MSYLPRHQVHKKKKSKAPLFFLILIVSLGVLIYTQEKRIRLFFAGDLRIKIEKQREKIFDSIESGDLTDIFTRDYHSYTQDFIEKEPTNPLAFFFKAEAYYFEILLSGVRFDSFSLTNHIRRPISSLLGDSEKARTDANEMFTLASRARSLDPNHPQSETNRFFLFLGESIRAKKNPSKLYEDYSGLPRKDLAPSLQHNYVWLLFYTVVRTGNVKALDELLKSNSEDNTSAKLLLTERESDFFKGLCHFFAKDYVNSLNHLRKVKTEEFDSITRNAILAEAKIFYAQNIPKKGVDLLLDAYNKSGKKDESYLEPLRVWAKEKPDLKIEIPSSKKEEDEIDEDI